MKKIITPLILVAVLVLVVVLIVLSGSQESKGGAVFIGSDSVRLSRGYSADINGITLTFNDLIQDYRCSKDEDCPESGGVTANITLKYRDQVENRNLASDEIPYEFAGRKISISDVRPDAKLGEQISQDSYRVTFRVKEVTNDDVEPETNSDTTTDASGEMSTDIVTRIDQGATAHNIKIVPTELVEDSRCPVNTTCVWAGTVKVSTLVSEIDQNSLNETRQFNLNESQQFNGRTITLVSVSPEKANTDIPPDNYQFTFRIQA
jgi:hypothetical protein